MGVQSQFALEVWVEVLKAALSAMIASLARLVVAIGTVASRLCYASFPIPGLVASFNVWFLKFASEVLNFFWIWRNLKRTAVSDIPLNNPREIGTGEWLEYTGAPVSTSDVIVWLPGGAFLYHDSFEISVARALLPRLAAKHGSAPRILVFRYPLPAKIPKTSREVDHVLGWLRKSCGMKRVILAGDSAGGYLTVDHYLALQARGDTNKIDAAIAFYPVLDLTLSSESINRNANKDGLHRNLLVSGVNSFTSGHGISGELDVIKRWSPVFAKSRYLHAAMKKNQPPLCLISGALDLLADDTYRFCDRAQRAAEEVAEMDYDQTVRPKGRGRRSPARRRSPADSITFSADGVEASDPHGALYWRPSPRDLHVERHIIDQIKYQCVNDGAFGVHCGALLPPALVGRSAAVRKALGVAFEVCSAALE